MIHWEECSVVDEWVCFVTRLLDGEKMAPLCREFAISRETGYKIFGGLRRTSGRNQRSRKGIWLVHFMEYDPGDIDLEEKTLQPLDDPLDPNVLPM
jgi:hypothetical protein